MGRRLPPRQRAMIKNRISELYVDGLKQDEIAESIKIKGVPIDQSTVSRFIKELEKDWFNAGVYNIDRAKREQLHKINVLELEYTQAWRKSKGLKRENTKVERTGGVNGGVDETRERKWREVGDPRYLQGIQWCIEQRCKILGLTAPTEHEERVTLVWDLPVPAVAMSEKASQN